MKLAPFTVHRPGSVGQASRLLADLGDDAAAYCGGTELLLAMKLGLASYEHLVDLKRVYGLRGIAADGGLTRIGAATTHHEIETSAALRGRYPEMSAMISQVANLRVRSAGTLGGNLCFADPHSDPASFLMAVGATLICQRAEATRRIPAEEFLTGLYETALAPGELLVAIELPARPERTGISHLRMKLTERPVVTVTALITLAPGTPSGERHRAGPPDRGLRGQHPVHRRRGLPPRRRPRGFRRARRSLRRGGRRRLHPAPRRRGLARLPAPPGPRPRPPGPGRSVHRRRGLDPVDPWTR